MEYVDASSDPSTVASELVELMRAESNVSWAQSQSCVHDLLQLLQQHCPGERLAQVVDALQEDVLLVSTSVDSGRVRECMSQLHSAQMDAQQRSWSCHEDEHTIIDTCKQLSGLMKLCDHRVPLHVLAEDNYTALLSLVLFLQMETRLSVRVQLQSTLHSILLVDACLVDVLLPTVLLEVLITGLVEQCFVQCVLSDHSLQLLVVLLCTQQRLECQQYDIINDDFLNRLLSEIECESWCADQCTLLLLALNLHQTQQVDYTLAVSTLIDHAESVPHLVERLLVLVNRDDDPIWPYPSQPVRVWSVLKLLHDVYSTCITVDSLLYSNDVPVLIDVLCRKCMNLTKGTQRLASVRLLHVICTRLPLQVSAQSCHIRECAQVMLDDEERQRTSREEHDAAQELLEVLTIDTDRRETDV